MTSRFSQVDEYGFVRPENFNYSDYELFMSNYLKILARRSKRWSSFLVKGKLKGSSPTLDRYIRKGVPSEHRSRVWLFTSGAVEAKKRFGDDLYAKMLLQTPDEELSEIIRTDLPRTFPENIFFNSNDEYQQQLYRILLAYGLHNRKVGYCQGLNYVAGILLLVTKSEDTSFWLLKMLVENILPDYYSPTMSGLIIDIDVLTELIRQKHPDLNIHLNYLGLPWPVIITKWFICLYCEVLPIETTLRVWDCLFNEGSQILFQVALSLIEQHEKDLMEIKQFGELVDYINTFTKGSYALDCHSFLKSLFKPSNTVKQKNLIMLRKKMISKKGSKERNQNNGS